MSLQTNYIIIVFFFFQAEDGIRDGRVTGVQTCALPIAPRRTRFRGPRLRTAHRRRRPLFRRTRGARSEERRVGKECRSRWSPDHLKKKNHEIHTQPGSTFSDPVASERYDLEQQAALTL